MEKLLCRVCLSDSGEFQTVFTSITLKESSTTMHLSEMICSFTQVQITLGDGLPDQICRACANQTLQMYSFKVQCEESDKILRRTLGSKHTKNMDLLNEFDQDCSNFDYDESLSDDGENLDLYEESTKPKPEKVKAFACTICHKQFTREDLLLRHKIAHAMKMQDFKEKLEDSDDSRSESSEYPNKDEVIEIDGTFPMDDTVNAIFIKNEDCLELSSANYQCVLCNYIAASGNLLNEHLTGEHLKIDKVDENEEFSCKICDQVVKDLNYFKKHIKKKHWKVRSDQKFSCPYCFMEYSKIGNFKKHIASHTHGQPEEDTDILEDSISKEYPCSHCPKVFPSKIDRKRHLARIGLTNKKNTTTTTVSSKKKPHICEICLKAFNQLSNLKDHLRTHNGEKPFLCPTCGKGFNQLGNLRQHQVRHSGVKSHICTTCGNGFASKGELHAHLRKHTGARPFVCDACGNGFTTSSSLTKHKRIHSGEKPYECEYCKMKFSRSGILSRHKRIHTGEKPYVCQICSKAFTQSNDLNSHLRIHTGEKPYKCDECGQPFRQSSALRTHKRIHLEPKPQQIRQLLTKKDRDVFVEDEEKLFLKFGAISTTV